ncbi:MAG: transposase, partial [Selenomonadaceae bacterium]|nr:transposase [Selenomonadaceae bacterium]
MLKSFKVMLVPNNEQRTRLFQFAGTARFAYNWALRKEREAHDAGEKFINNNDLRKDFTVLRNSGEYPWLKTISNNVTKQAIKDCVDAFINFFKKQSRYPRFKSKRRGDFSFYQDTDKIRITATQVKLEMISTSRRKNRRQLNWIRLAEVERIPVGVKYKQPRITFDGLNWWLSVTVEFEPEKTQADGEPLGIDLGIKNLAVCSDGTVYPNINRTTTVRKLKKKQRRLQRSISCKYEMNNTK